MLTSRSQRRNNQSIDGELYIRIQGKCKPYAWRDVISTQPFPFSFCNGVWEQNLFLFYGAVELLGAYIRMEISNKLRALFN